MCVCVRERFSTDLKCPFQKEERDLWSTMLGVSFLCLANGQMTKEPLPILFTIRCLYIRGGTVLKYTNFNINMENYNVRIIWRGEGGGCWLKLTWKGKYCNTDSPRKTFCYSLCIYVISGTLLYMHLVVSYFITVFILMITPYY